MKLTEAQAEAVYSHDRNLVVVAGAGSGKTRVLVERYLALLDANPHWPLNALVAITFTRKAAQEMRDRVRQALEARLSSAAPEQENLWAQRLASMDSARIDTIHGLCATILRANAAEAGLDPDFSVLDEVEAALLLDSAIEMALQDMAAADDPALALFAEYDSSSVTPVLRTFTSVELRDPPQDLMVHWQVQWQQAAEAHVQRLCTDATLLAALDWIPDGGWPEGDRLMDVWAQVREGCEILLNYDAALDSRLLALDHVAGAINLRGGSKKAWSEDGLKIAKDYLRDVRTCCQDAQSRIGPPPGPLDEEAARLIPLWLRLIRQVQSHYAEAKQREALLDFDDLEQHTRDLLANHPQVWQRYQAAEFQHLLVDEFQDTNARQWAIVQALADPQRPGSLFIVGDQKQSIYAFRGADVSVFGAVRQQLVGIGGSEIALNRSFRSHRPLIGCFNALFDHILEHDPASPVARYQTGLDQPLEADRLDPPGDSPGLELLLVNTGSESAAPYHSEDYRRWEAYQIARRVQAMIADGTPVHDGADGTRPMVYDDVALLFQSTSNIVLYESVFKALGLPYVTIAGRGYYNREEVWDLLNLLKALYNPADNLALASALRSPLFGLSDDALFALRLLRDRDSHRLLLWDALDYADAVPAVEQTLVVFARDCLDNLAAMAGRMTIAELLREALFQTGYLATLTGLPNGARRRGNVEKLIDLAENSGKITLGAFEAYLSDLSAREVREGEADMDVSGAVTLMTIHASKGLEFPCVVLVDSSWRRNTRDGSVAIYDEDCGLCCKVYDEAEASYRPGFSYTQASYLSGLRDDAERRRLLYVAATRARDYLLASGQIKRDRADNWSANGWLGQIIDALDLQSELPDSGVSHIDREWGSLRVEMASEMPAPNAYMLHEVWPAWDSVPDALPQAPPLLEPVAVDRSAAARHLTATQIADLGAIPVAPYYAERFQRQMLQDAPGQIGSPEVSRSQARLIGELVHEALRWWQPGQDVAGLFEFVKSAAWERGLVDPIQNGNAVREAMSLIGRFQRSQIALWVAEAEVSYRELPFIFANGQHIIHGVIDLLLQLPGGEWRLVDYKTNNVSSQNEAKIHAQRYYMQVGCYAEALREQLGVEVEVYIHYLRPGLTVAIQPEDWRMALASMEKTIGNLT